MKIDGIRLTSAETLAPLVRKYLSTAREHGRWSPSGGDAEYDAASTTEDLVFTWPYGLVAGTVGEVVGNIAGRPDSEDARWCGVYRHQTGELDRDAGRLVEVEAVLTWTADYTYLLVYDVSSGADPRTVAVGRWLS